jgi:hypothetical protein
MIGRRGDGRASPCLPACLLPARLSPIGPPHLRWSAYLLAVASLMGSAWAPKKRVVRKRRRSANSRRKLSLISPSC